MSQYEMAESKIASLERRIAYYENVLRELDTANMSINEKAYLMNNLLALYDSLRDARSLEWLTKFGYD